MNSGAAVSQLRDSSFQERVSAKRASWELGVGGEVLLVGSTGDVKGGGGGLVLDSEGCPSS